MQIGGIVAVVVVVVVAVGAAAALIFRRSQDDEHSVEHYHRQLHTLEEMRSHPAVGDEAGARLNVPERGATEENGNADAASPASAFLVSGSRTVRLTDLDTPSVPPAPPPAVPSSSEPVAFDDAGAEVSVNGAAGDRSDESPTSFMRGEDKAMHSIDHRPRRLGAPLAAIAVVTVLIVVLIVAGFHSTTAPPPKHHAHTSSSSATSTTVHSSTSVPAHGAAGAGHGHHARATTTTTTTAPPAVSGPTAATAHAATYGVDSAAYSLSLSATGGACWVEAENPANGSILFTGTLQSGQSHIVPANGSVVVIAGAPGSFAATVNGAPVTLPPSPQAPFTLTFQPPAGSAAGTPPASTTPTT